ncbi:MAG: hypothetical protein M3279_04910 [Actinomycetota bacterium]|nr:hypothetical protein [Actinomycetota bacterium]
MRIRLRLLDAVVDIETEEADAAQLLGDLWRPLETQEPGEAARTYVVARDRTAWKATAGDAVEAEHETLWGVTDALRYRMLELCEERLQRFVTLHAAAVARGADLVLLAGESGAGKTTLTLALLEGGWTYLSDDLAPVSPETGLVHPFPKPLGVKDPAAWATLRDAYSGSSLDPPSGSFLVPATRWAIAPGPLPVRLLVFPRFTAGGALDVEPVSAAKGAALASAYVRRLDPATVVLLHRLCSGASCLRLGYGSSDAARTALEDVLNHRE